MSVVDSSSTKEAKCLRLPRTAKEWNRVRTCITTGYVVALFTVYLFYFGSEGYNTLDLAKQKVFYCVHLLYFFLILFTHLLNRKRAKISQVVSHMTTCDTAALVLLMLVWISAFQSKYWPDTLGGLNSGEGALKLTVYIVAFLLVYHHSECGPYIYVLLGVVCTVFCLLCIIQFQDFNPFGLFQDGTLYDDYMTIELPGQFCGTIGNTDLVASFLVLCIVTLVFAMACVESRWCIALLIPIGLGVYVLWKTWVLLGVVGLVLGLLLSWPVTSLNKRLQKALALFGVSGFVLVVLWFIPYESGMPGELHALLHGQADSSFGSGRFYIWSGLLKDMEGAWLWGHGPDSVIAANIEPFIAQSEVLGVPVINLITDAHNVYLNTLYCLGVPALLAFVLLLLHALCNWVLLASKNAHIAALGSGVLAYSISAFFCLSHFIVAPFFWCALGLLEAEIHCEK